MQLLVARGPALSKPSSSTNAERQNLMASLPNHVGKPLDECHGAPPMAFSLSVMEARTILR